MSEDVPEGGKPFADLIRDYRNSALAEVLDESYHEVVRGVRKYAKPGSITLTFTISPREGDVDILDTSATVSATPPKKTIPKAIFFADDQGNLHRDDPKQRTLFKTTGSRDPDTEASKAGLREIK